jgi:hypothetical protein
VTAVERGEQWAKALRFPNWATISRHGLEGGDLFAGHDGNVYRYRSGAWQKYERGGWTGDGLSMAVRDQLSHDRAARHEGNRRMSVAKHTDSVSFLPPDSHEIGSLYEGIVQDT